MILGLESTCKRNGTINLFAALEVSTGQIHAMTTEPEQKTKKGFLKFMDELLEDLPSSEEFHIIMDNHSIHKNDGKWLEEHPNVFFHYTPTSASWLNMIEIWLGIFTLKSLRKSSFSSTDGLNAHIKSFVASYNKYAHPFEWRKREVKGCQLTNSIKNFCK